MFKYLPYHVSLVSHAVVYHVQSLRFIDKQVVPSEVPEQSTYSLCTAVDVYICLHLNLPEKVKQ